MNRNLLEEIQLYEGIKDELIKRISIERGMGDKVNQCLCHYRSKHIYTALDTDHCIDMICKYVNMKKNIMCVENVLLDYLKNFKQSN